MHYCILRSSLDGDPHRHLNIHIVMNASAILIHLLYTFGWLSEGIVGCSLYIECVIVLVMVAEVPDDKEVALKENI